MKRLEPLAIGSTFGRLTVIGETFIRDGASVTPIRCVCGNERNAPTHKVLSGGLKSCGCRASMTRHGEGSHCGAKTYSTEYRSWLAMKSRCENKNNAEYRNYGGRGINVCERWSRDFSAFLSDVGRKPSPAHSLDRLDVDGSYEPLNVRWATKSEQSRNRRDSVRITVKGETKGLYEWAQLTGLSHHTIYTRLRRGWPSEMAVLSPAASHR